MPFVPFKKGGGKAPKAAKTGGSKKLPAKGNPFASGAAGQPKKTKRSPF